MDIHKECSEFATANLLDLAYNQYGIQWQKIGNMQSSAGTILTIISIIASLMVGTIVQISDIENLIKSLGIFSYSFYLAFIFSFIYLIIAAVYVYQVIKVKYVNVLKSPKEIQDNVLQELSGELRISDHQNSIQLLVDTNILLKVDEEIKEVGKVLHKNQKNYEKCLKASFLSLFATFLTLGHVISNIFFNNVFYRTVIAILCYFLILGIVVIFWEGENIET